MITSGEDAALRALTERTDGQYAVSTTESALTASLDQIEGREERHRHDSEDRGARLVTLRQALTATGAHRRSALARWGGAMTLAATLLLLATTRPALTASGHDAGERGSGADTNVFVVLDRTVDARSDIDALLDRYPQARFAVITFAPEPTLTWPLSRDVWSLQPEVDALTALPPGDPALADAAAPVRAPPARPPPRVISTFRPIR